MNDNLDKRRLAWAYLSRVFEGPSADFHELLARNDDVEAIAAGIKRRESWLGAILKQTQQRYHIDQAAQDLNQIQELGGRLVTPDDAEWPKVLFDRGFTFAALQDFQHIGPHQHEAFAPHALWVRGLRLDMLTEQAVGIVGTRAVSSYGARVTKNFSAGLAAKGYTIISGGALGVDTHAHEAALRAGAMTIAVLARGVDKAYPAKNAPLFGRIVENGAVISEYPPGSAPHRHRFLTRNRLVAALSLGVVATEAPYRSGALNTLSWASALGRQAMAVPGSVDAVGSLGCHERIRKGLAHLVGSADQVHELLAPVGQEDVEEQLELEFPASPIQQLSQKERRVFDAVSMDATLTADVAREAGMPIGLVVRLLLDLERQGLVRRVKDCWARSTFRHDAGQ